MKLIVIGAGSRGRVYASYALENPQLVRVVGVAEPRAYYREDMAKHHHIAAENAVGDWRELAEREKFADAVIIATPDALHYEPAVAFAEKGYHMLLEKPLATNERHCQEIIEAVMNNGIICAVAHVLRYTKYTRKLKAILDAGMIGYIVSVQHLEPVGYWP